MKKKIAIVIPSLRGGGAERVIVNILNHLDLEKIELTLVVVNKVGPYIKYLPNNIRVIDLNSERVRHSVIKMIKALNEVKPDVILSTLGHLNLFLILIKRFIKGSPRLIVREANTPSMSLTKLSQRKQYYYKLIYRLLYPKADLIIAQCYDMKHDIIKTFRLKESKVIHIYNPIDISMIGKNAETFNPYNNSKINIVAIGRLTYQKGFDTLLKAFKIVNQEFPKTGLTILGDGELKNALEEQVNDLNLLASVSIIGFKDNPYPYYKNAELFVLSSRWEGFPNVLLEALACNTKIVATNCKSGPREILEDGRYGRLTKVDNVESLAQDIIEALKGENLSQNRAKDFDIKEIIKQYEKTLLNNYK